jgi:peptidoglycan/LPS O-acetylase OafA/YrhL
MLRVGTQAGDLALAGAAEPAVRGREDAQLKLPYLPAIDGVRAIAALAVVIFHANPLLLPTGFFGVDIFFAISGFVVTYSILGRSFASHGDFLSYFYKRRVVRILPAMFFWVVLAAALSILFVPRSVLSQDDFVTGIAALFGLSNVYLAWISGNYFSPSAELNPFTHTWSLGVEEQFYIAASVIVVLTAATRNSLHRSRGLIACVVLLALLSAGASAYLSSHDAQHAFYMIDSRFWELGAGVLLALATPRIKPSLERLPQTRRNVLGAASLLLVLISIALPVRFSIPFPQAILPVAATVALMTVLATGDAGVAARLLCLRPVNALGKASYSIYLAHWPVMVLLRWTVGLDQLWLQISSILLSVALGWLSYRFLEDPIRTSSQIRAMPPLRTIAAALGVGAVFGLAIGVAFIDSDQLTLSHTGDRPVWSGFFTRDVAARSCGVTVGSLPNFDSIREAARIQVQACRGEPASRRNMYVVGDSHAGAYRRMFVRYADASRTSVSIYSKGGCQLFNLKAVNASHGPACAAFARKTVAELETKVRPGDIVFAAAMRTPYRADMWGQAAKPDAHSTKDVDAAYAEADAFFSDMRRRGAVVILEAPLPVFATPAFRCADWFNRMNPVCRPGFVSSRAEQEHHRAAVLERMKTFSAERGLALWDPLPALCDPSRCPIFLDGKPLMGDGDHISGYGDDRVAPAFIAFATGLTH